MPRPRKTGAAAVQDAALGIGHNAANDDFVKDIMGRFAKKQRAIDALRAEQKEILREGKEGGVLKTAIRKAYKDLMMTSEQKEARDEVESARKSYVDICREVGLFVPEEEAA